MLALQSRLGVVDVAGTVVLGLLHAVMGVAYIVPGLARGSATATAPGRISVVTYVDQLALPAWQIGFTMSALLLLLAVRYTRWLVVVHGIGAGMMATYTAALWAGYILSDPRPSIVTAVGFTATLLWHGVLAVTYNAALSLPPRRASGRRREEPSP